jgi:hypothetical protein
MQHSSVPGVQPSVSSRLIGFLQGDLDSTSTVEGDELDQLIATQDLVINRFLFFRDLDMVLFVLTNRRIINRRLSAYPFLQKATDQQLTDFVVSANGISWPALDADLSLRGFLLEEVSMNFQNSPVAL